MDKQLQDKINQSRNEQLERAGAYEELIRVAGFKHLKADFANQVQALATEMMTTDGPLSEGFESRRQQLIGVKRLLGRIQSDLDALEAYRKEQDGKPTGPTEQ